MKRNGSSSATNIKTLLREQNYGVGVDLLPLNPSSFSIALASDPHLGWTVPLNDERHREVPDISLLLW